MKKIVTFGFLALLSVSCNQAEKEADKTEKTGTEKTAYAYSIDKPDNWNIGGTKNNELALNALKAFENNKIDESLGYFADTVQWRSDNFIGKLSKDSLKSIFTTMWNATSSLKINMHDFVSVISKDKKDEYVTMWYTQTVTDKKGKIDSVAVINDIKISNGKIVELDEAFRHFPVKKP